MKMRNAAVVFPHIWSIMVHVCWNVLRELIQLKWNACLAWMGARIVFLNNIALNARPIYSGVQPKVNVWKCAPQELTDSSTIVSASTAYKIVLFVQIHPNATDAPQAFT